ncbi:MAG TPA: SPOR domain-containing protein [Nitrosospira sp.]|nr:SPOR domain-containing protein [Nitrosospira sp.]
MAKTVSEQEIQLRKRARRRLVGAVTLAIAVVVILPMVLDSKPEQRDQEIDIRIPSEDLVEELGPESASLEESTPLKESASITEAPAAAKKPGAEIVREERASSRSDVMAFPSAADDPDTPAASKGKNVRPGSGYVVQLGAFSDPAKADQQMQKLASQNIAAYTETLKSGKAGITRVRLGPFATREEAESTRQKLKGLGFQGVVTEK